MTDYGSDWGMSPDCTDLDSLGTLVSGRRCLAEALARRLQTPLGRLLDDPQYGYDLTGELGDDLAGAQVARIARQAAAECEKDERVVAASATGTYLPGEGSTGTLTIAITVQDGLGPFRLVLAASAVSVSLLQVQG